MFEIIENEYLVCKVNYEGAQLSSLVSKDNDKEYIWYGREEIWYGQAPILFPVIGQLKNDAYLYGGKSYPMAKHGFARKLPFELYEKTASEVSFILASSDKTRVSFPFEFELTAGFSLEGKTLRNNITVKSLDEKAMYFSLGAHPGFNCAVGDIIEFEKDETVFTERIDSDNLLIDKKFPLLQNSREIVITKEIFEPDALIISGLQSKKLKIKGDNEIEFTFGDCPVLGIWAKPGAPYVCIEPWYGINDSREVYDDISEKREIRCLEPGGEFSLVWSAEIIR